MQATCVKAEPVVGAASADSRRVRMSADDVQVEVDDEAAATEVQLSI